MYEEKIYMGKLRYRTEPDGPWKVCDENRLHERIMELEDINRDLKAALRTCKNAAAGALKQYGE